MPFVGIAISFSSSFQLYFCKLSQKSLQDEESAHLTTTLQLYSGWCGEVRDVKYCDSGSVTVVYRVTIRGTDGEVSIFIRNFYTSAKVDLKASAINFNAR